MGLIPGRHFNLIRFTSRAMKRERLIFAWGLVVGFTLVSCAGYQYRYFGLEGVKFDQGTLMGPNLSYDLPFVSCAPIGINKHPCVVMFAKDFIQMKAELLDLRNQLSACQRGG